MADGTGGNTVQDANNYVEPPADTGNRSFTDYNEQLEVKLNKGRTYSGFRDRRVR